MEVRKSVLFCYIFTLSMLIISSGCGLKGGTAETTRIPITIYKPAAIDIRSRNIEKIAVASVDGKNSNNIKAAELLTKSLKDTLIYSVIESAEVDNVLLVNGLAIKSYMEKGELQKLGKAFKTDAFFLIEVKERAIVNEVYNKVMTEKEKTGDFEFKQNPEGKLEYIEAVKDVEVEMECKTKMGKVSINYKLYDSNTGNQIFDQTESLSEEVDAFCYRVNLNPGQMSKEEEKNLLDEIMKDLSDKFVEKLTPPSKTELVVFEMIPNADTFSERLIRIGIDYAKIGEWKKAIDSFEQCQRMNRKTAEVDYNLGIAYRGYGWHEKALVQFKEADKKSPKNLYKEAIKKTKEMIDQNVK